MAKKTARTTELSTKASIKKKLIEVFRDVEDGFIKQSERSDDQMDYWDCYNCQLGPKQYYNGTSRIFVPIVHNAIDARKTRFVNQVFPQSGRYVDVITENGDLPHAETALLENYVRKAQLRTKVLPALCRNGDIEGQYNLYVDWTSRVRHTAWRETKPVKVEGVEMEGVDEIDTIESDIVTDEWPDVEVLSDADVLILPITSDGVEDALEAGGSVTILRRWSKGTLRKKIDAGEIAKDEGEALLKSMEKPPEKRNKEPAKHHADSAGIKSQGKSALIYETWTKLKVDGELRLCKAFYGGESRILGCRLNPFWNDRCPLISVPVEKVAGVAKGISKVKAVTEMQYAANDAVNEGMDSAAYALLPIIMTDPAKNPRVGSMILDQAAIWETDPNTTKFASFPQLWKDAFEIVAASKNEIFQTLSVNPAMMPQQTGGKAKKMSQAEIANEQQVDILTTADAVSTLEAGVLTPLIERFAEYDMQFRDTAVTIRAFGQMGIQAAMERVPPLQMGRRYTFRWFGVEAARTAAQVQQQIAAVNVLRGIPPNFYQGRRIDLTAAIETMLSNVFGPRIAPLVFVDTRRELSVPADLEDELMREGHQMLVHPLDDDIEHLRAHAASAREEDPHGTIRAHMQAHQRAIMVKSGMQANQQQPQGNPGAPGAGGGKGMTGTPRLGAQPAGPRLIKQAPGAIPPDRMPAAGSVGMPRRM